MNPILRTASVGFVLGALWGVSARLWMRMISTEPEFSWTGTLMIIGLAGLLGTGVGLIYATRKLGRHQWLGIALIPGLALFMGPGFPFAPSFLVGGFAWRKGRGHVGDRLLQLLGLVVLVGIPLAAWWLGREEAEASLVSTADQVRGVLGFFVLSLGLAAGGSMMWRPSMNSRGMNPPGPESGSSEVGLLSADGGVVAMAGVDDGVVGQREE